MYFIGSIRDINLIHLLINLLVLAVTYLRSERCYIYDTYYQKSYREYWTHERLSFDFVVGVEEGHRETEEIHHRKVVIEGSATSTIHASVIDGHYEEFFSN